MHHGHALLALGIPLWILSRATMLYLNKRKGGKISLKREAVLFLFCVYALCVVEITLIPLSIFRDTRSQFLLSANFVPFAGSIKAIASTTGIYSRDFMIRHWIRNIGGNAVLLLPLGIFLPLLWSKFKSIGKTALFAFLLSLCIEILQLLSSYAGYSNRIFDIDDILLNTAGAVLGALFYNLCAYKILPKFNATRYLRP